MISTFFFFCNSSIYSNPYNSQELQKQLVRGVRSRTVKGYVMKIIFVDLLCLQMTGISMQVKKQLSDCNLTNLAQCIKFLSFWDWELSPLVFINAIMNYPSFMQKTESKGSIGVFFPDSAKASPSQKLVRVHVCVGNAVGDKYESRSEVKTISSHCPSVVVHCCHSSLWFLYHFQLFLYKIGISELKGAIQII